MRELWIGAACVAGFIVVAMVLGNTFKASTQQPAHAMEMQQLRSEAETAKAATEQVNAQLEKAKFELLKVTALNEQLKLKVALLETRLEDLTKSPKSK
jgi:chromosome segregation ATPase